MISPHREDRIEAQAQADALAEGRAKGRRLLELVRRNNRGVAGKLGNN